MRAKELRMHDRQSPPRANHAPLQNHLRTRELAAHVGGGWHSEAREESTWNLNLAGKVAGCAVRIW